MAKKKTPIKWTQKQIEVAHLLQQGLLRGIDIANQVGVAPSVVSKVKAALKKGHIPPEIGYEVKQDASLSVPYIPTPNDNQLQGYDNGEDEVLDASGHTSHPQALQPSVQEATFLRFVPVTFTYGISPIMQNAKRYLIEKQGWSPDVSWVDIIDITFIHYFKSFGIILQNYYETWKEPEAIVKPTEPVKKAQAKHPGGEQSGITPSPVSNPKALPFKSQNTPAVIEVSPIMVNALLYFIRVNGWLPESRWVDLIDTIFIDYFASIGVLLQGWYDVRGWYKINHPPQMDAPGPAWEKPVEKNPQDNDSAIIKLAEMVTKKLIAEVNEVK